MTGLVCENCATPLPGGSKYCNECGTPVPGQRAVPRVVQGVPTDLRQALQMATAGEYEIHQELGRGGMGSVFLAREIGLDRLVAIKVLPPTLAFDEGLIVRFTREARMVAKLHHPNIIPVYRVHHSHNLAFYTMHFVSGRSLSEVMVAGGSFTLDQVEKVMRGAAAGLGYAHKRGVIHRDVKPANILLDAEGGVHLTDFGIAKALVGSTQLTETGAVIGTPQYMAPEQCDGRAVDGRADQYSLAVVGYQLLAGHPPFEADSMKELLYHHLFTPPRPLGDIRPEVPAPLRDAIHKALSKDPSERFASMEDFVTAVEGKGPPVFVNWIDGASKSRDRRKRKQRRATDLAPTAKLTQAPWTVAAGGPFSGYRRAVVALGVAVVSIGAIGILAVTQGAGLAGSLQRSVRSGGADSLLELGAILVTPAAGVLDEGSGVPYARQNRQLVMGNEGEERPLAMNGTNGTNGASRGTPPATGLEAEPKESGGDQSAASPTVVKAERPSLPAEVLGQLRLALQQGVTFYNARMYQDADDALQAAYRQAVQALGAYGASEPLAQVMDEIEAFRDKNQLECRITVKSPCP